MRAALIIVAMLAGCAGSTRDQIRRGLVAAQGAQQITARVIDAPCMLAQERCQAFATPADCDRLKACLQIWRGLEWLLMGVDAVDKALDTLPLEDGKK